MEPDKSYISQLEKANHSLQDKIEELEKKLNWEEKTKDLRNLGHEYHKMHDEIYKINVETIVNSFLSIDVGTILSMWGGGYRISTEVIDSYDHTLIGKKIHRVSIVGPFNDGRIGSDRDKFFAMALSVLRSNFHPLIKDKCFCIIEHNRIDDFNGSICESAHVIDAKYSKVIFDFIKKIDICKNIMNGECVKAYLKCDTF